MNDQVPLAAVDRRVWIIGKGRDHVVAFGEGTLVTGDVTAEQGEAVVAAFEAGQFIVPLLKDASYIPLDSVKSIEANIKKANIDIHWKPPESKEAKWEFVFCQDADERAAVMDGLAERLGWQREVAQANRWKEAFFPLLCVIGFTILALCMYMVATGQDKSSGGSRTIRTNAIGVVLAAIVMFFGPALSCVIFVIILIPLAAWLVAVLVRPPVLDSLTPTG